MTYNRPKTVLENQPANFDTVARPYRWLEYLTFGPMLERCRFYFLPRLPQRRHALVIGDGDGRFIVRLLLQNPTLRADAVDTSANMLRVLTERCHRVRVADRLTTHQADALTFVPPPGCDLVATHFFLDCLTQAQLDTLVSHIAPSLAPGSLWLVSDFQVPAGPMHLPARALVRTLYASFRALTRLRTNRLPDHAAALTRAGLTRTSHHPLLGGILFTEVWQKSSTMNA
jgi:SAM-dependent methyltransferase